MLEPGRKIKQSLFSHLITALIFFGIVIVSVSCEKDENIRPDIILITIDTLRADRTGFMGYDNAETPCMDMLAEKAIVFNRAYSPAPYTLPSHASILTGTYPPYHGIRANSGFRLGDTPPSLPEILKKKGYKTGAVIGSRVMEAKFGLNRGFDFYEDRISEERGSVFRFNERSAEANLEIALNWISSVPSPYFLWLHLFDPHYPYSSHQEIFGNRFSESPYDGEIAYVDLQLEKLVRFLEKKGTAKSTLIIVTSDHGEGLYDHGEKTHGYFIYEENIRVPLLLHFPGIIAPGRVDEPVSVVDIFPTVMDICEIEFTEETQGLSLLDDQKHDALYCENITTQLDFGWSPIYGIISGQWKYIRLPKPEIYNLNADLGERINLIDSEEEKIAELDSILVSLQKKYSISRNSNKLEMTDEDQEMLRSLGYISFADGIPGWEGADDPKDMLEIYNGIRTSLDFISQELDEGMPLDKGINQGILYLEDLVASGLRNAGVYRFLYDYYARKGLHDKALMYCEKALVEAPQDFRIHEALGLIKADLGRDMEALKHFMTAEQIMPGDFSVTWMIAELSFKIKSYETAREYYNKIICLNPENTYRDKAMLKIAFIFNKENNTVRACEILDEICVSSSSYDARKEAAVLYKSMGNAEEAIDILNGLIRLKPSDTEMVSLHEITGDIHRDLGENPSAAHGSYKKALEYNMDEESRVRLNQKIAELRFKPEKG